MGWFKSDIVENPEDRFSRLPAHIGISALCYFGYFPFQFLGQDFDSVCNDIED